MEDTFCKAPVYGKMPHHRSLTIRDLPESERPRERLARLGAEALSEQELLACILGRGVARESVLMSAQRLLATFGSLRGIAEASVEQLSCVHGIGSSKAIQLKAAAELSRRVAQTSNGLHPAIDSSEKAADILRPILAHKKKEFFVILLLDNRHHLIRASTIATGSLSATIVHPRELFKEAISASAAAVILGHNHPSGDPDPSDHDLRITKRLVAAGHLLGIEVLDHVIVGSHGCVSLKTVANHLFNL